MRAKRSILVLVCLATVVLTACATRIGDFTIVSTKNYEAGQKYHMIGRRTGEDKVFVFIIPFGTPNMKNAVDKAIESATGGVYLTNAVVEAVSGPFSLAYRVTGDVWSPLGVGAAPAAGEKVFEVVREDDGLYLQSGNTRIRVEARP